MKPLLDLAVPAVTFLLLLAVGLDLAPTDFARVRRQHRVLAAGLLGPLLVLPPLALLLVVLSRPSPDLQNGLLLVAACPIGGISNTYSYLARASTALGKDRQQAFRWYLRAAREGVIRAQFNVGLCYRDGDGIKASKLKALEWLQKAARRRHARARDVLRGMLQSTESLDRRKGTVERQT